ncbi:hypothetical protein A1O1_05942 [Capronia coronata CBS 617.96]|uniref:Photolyase/cryptochrome alpha/beta domain-containing protein n=1 Tax=Capronia coronata CBS 617.96 TaxID=1182541 RepID=W9XYF9_9EURO|nr:uncharacterized protein A1O1_05942 [Capronia coronata CBS 617.96]EXJ85577.1 hypothetical protein A1O1_05942 [Capronia coronata CBS 617.96]
MPPRFKRPSPPPSKDTNATTITKTPSLATMEEPSSVVPCTPTSLSLSSFSITSPSLRMVYWFRTDLRLDDSPALTHALSLNPTTFIPLWIWDPHYTHHQRGSINRWSFLLACMDDLSASLTRLNPTQKLHVVRARAAPAKVLAALLRHWKIDVLVLEKDPDAYARLRDADVADVAEALGVRVVSVPGRTLFDSDEVVERNGGKPTLSIAQFGRVVEKIGDGRPGRPVEAPTRLPDPLGGEEMSLEGVEVEMILENVMENVKSGACGDTAQTTDLPAAEPGMDYNAVQRTLGAHRDTQFSGGLMGPYGTFSVPTLEEMGMDCQDVHSWSHSDPKTEAETGGGSGTGTGTNTGIYLASVTAKQPSAQSAQSSKATRPTPSYHQGGESAGLALLAHHLADENYIATFEKPKTAPTAFDPPATTLLSPHLHFGSVSVRRFWWAVQDVIERRRAAKGAGAGNISPHPVNLPGQLLFRDMYFAAYAAVGVTFGQTIGNPVARFIPWSLPSRYNNDDSNKYNNSKNNSAVSHGNTNIPPTITAPTTTGTYIVNDPIAEEYFQRWKYGCTGFPWIDALMRQLRQEGWIHHLGRHAVACFLTRGGCYVSWERGAEVFEEWLLDHEVACNAGNWMWLSCTAFFAQFHRIYSPTAFPKKWDPSGQFVRRYVPELRAFGDKFIYEPHKAPIADQKKWGCLIKNDGHGLEYYVKNGGETNRDNGCENKSGGAALKLYPKPMFDFSERRQFCIEKMKQAYDVGLHGDDEKVLNGEWKAIFGFEEEHQGQAECKEEANGLILSTKIESQRRSPPRGMDAGYGMNPGGESRGAGTGMSSRSEPLEPGQDVAPNTVRAPRTGTRTVDRERGSTSGPLAARDGILSLSTSASGTRGVKRERGRSSNNVEEMGSNGKLQGMKNSRLDHTVNERAAQIDQTHPETEADVQHNGHHSPLQRKRRTEAAEKRAETGAKGKQQTLDSVVTRLRSRQK